MTWFFCDRRSDFAAAFPEICVRAIPAGVHNGEVTFELTRPEESGRS